MMTENSYKNIFKTTFLFSFVQVFNIIVKVGTNKIVAILLGAEGMGIISLFNSSISLLKTGCGLGINQSAIRDISSANKANELNTVSQIISIVNKIVLFTAIFGIFITIILSPYLSQCSFGNTKYTISFIFLALVVGMNIYSDGQLGILTGMRHLRELAKASMIGALVGLISALPFYYFLGNNGIVPSLLVTAFSALFFSNYYVKKITYEHIKYTIKELFSNASQMVKMGIALMLVSFISSLFDLVVSAYINRTGGMVNVGLYQAGATIINGYFGIITTAMTTDYYPRISAIYQNNSKLNIEMNRQSEISLYMIFPIILLFICFSSFFVDFLYTSNFNGTKIYIKYAVVGIIFSILGDNMGMILLAKQKAKIFITTILIQRIVILIIYLCSYYYFSLLGLGIAFVIRGVISLLITVIIIKKLYNINYKKHIYRLLWMILFVSVLFVYLNSFNIFYIRITQLFIFILLAIYCIRKISTLTSINMQTIKDKVKTFRK